MESEGERWFCRPCRARYPADRARCVVCRKRSDSGRTCPQCREHASLDGVVAVGSYRDFLLQDAVKRLKFRGIRSLAEPLGELLARRVVAAGMAGGPPIIAVPLPLHRRRERQRGYNQARLLAEALGHRLHLSVREILKRVQTSAPQTSIYGHGSARRKNVANAFTLSETPSLAGTRVLLIDDVVTTGATLSVAARALEPLRPAEMWGVVVTRG